MISIAHRGWHADYPENSRAAIQASYGAGFAGAECDVRRTSDSALVIIHDDKLVAGSGQRYAVATTPLSVLQDQKGEENAHSIAILSDILSDLPPNYQLHLELKVPGLVTDVIQAAARASVSHQVYLLLRHRSDLRSATDTIQHDQIVFTHALLAWALFVTRRMPNTRISTKNIWLNRFCLRLGVAATRVVHMYTINNPNELKKLQADRIKVVYSNTKLDEI